MFCDKGGNWLSLRQNREKMKRLSQRISEREKRINKEFDLMMEDIEEMDGSLYFPFWKFLKEKQQVYDFLKYLRWFYNKKEKEDGYRARWQKWEDEYIWCYHWDCGKDNIKGCSEYLGRSKKSIKRRLKYLEDHEEYRNTIFGAFDLDHIVNFK